MTDPQATSSDPTANKPLENETAAEANTETTDSAAQPSSDLPTFGWNAYAERINGRFAMVGFVALLMLELITRQDFFTWLGL